MRLCPYCHNPISDAVVDQLQAENESLRELVRDIWDAYRCEEVAPNVAKHWHDRMRELGVEP